MADTHSITGKSCNKCGAFKLLEEFNRKKEGKYGRQPTCRACEKVEQAARRAKDPEKRREYNRAWAEKNREYLIQKGREYYSENREQIVARRREAYANDPSRREKIYEWRENNPDRFKAICARYYVKHAESVKARAKAWRSENPDRVTERRRNWINANRSIWRAQIRTTSAARRARKRAAAGSFGAKDVSRLFGVQKGRCACCKRSIRRGYHIDHILPLALGGSNDPTNLQLLCPTCNLRKNAKHPVSFMQEQGFLI